MATHFFFDFTNVQRGACNGTFLGTEHDYHLGHLVEPNIAALFLGNVNNICKSTTAAGLIHLGGFP